MPTSSPHLPAVGQRMAIYAICFSVLSFLPNTSFAFGLNSRDQTRMENSQSRQISFSIQAKTLRFALLEFSKQSGIQLIYVPTKDEDDYPHTLFGAYSIKDALDILLKGSSLEYEFSEENTLTIRKAHQDNRPNPQGDENALLLSEPLEDDDGKNTIEEIMSIGSRAKGRTALKTPVPVDSIDARSMLSTGETETGRILQSLAPSFNFSSSSISDGTDAVKPATLRGLGPDQTLVLINGKRRHISALVHVNTSVGRGSTGVDMNAISPSSIKRVEVLRSGASAQYGSDAIAGVINIILKDDAEGGGFSTTYGQTYAGDGETFVASANYGFKIVGGGRLTLSGEYRNKESTNRAGLSGCLQFDTGEQEACALGNTAIDPREATFNRQNFRVGDSDSEQKSLTVNLSLPMTETAEFYMFATYSDRENQSAGFFRRANEYSRTVTEIYPNGFLPMINSKIRDHSILAGTTWTLDNGWSIDSSIITGGNDFQFVIYNSLNASFGADSPTTANAGTLKINQTTANLDVSKSFKMANISFGTEWRHERYQIIQGDPISYQDGGQLNFNCPGCDINPIPYAPGFQVFTGFSPDNAVNETRNNVAFYADVEVDLTSNFLINLASRYESYSDFGNRINAKFAARYQLSPVFALRGSLSSGFRAPSMQQKFFNSTSTQFIEVDGNSIAQERGTFRNDSDVAHALNIPELKKETSTNYSLGFVATPLENMSFTIDFYRIDIRNRIAISGSIPISETLPAVTAATGATDGQFFTNMANTKTEGVDIVINYDIPMPVGQSLKLSLAGNKTETFIKSGPIDPPLDGVDDFTFFGRQDRSIIEDWQPSSRVNFTLDYTYQAWSVILRNNFYGPYMVCEDSCDIASGEGQNIQEFKSKVLTDLQLSYNFKKLKMNFTLGANNLFNVFPDVNKIGQFRAGSIDGIVSSPGVFTYSRRSAPFGHNGGYYYVRVAKKF